MGPAESARARSQTEITLTDPSSLKRLLDRHGVLPTKRFGQHFLVSERVVGAIVEHADGFAGVLEIGPGVGVLTQPLSHSADKLIALEVDADCIPILAETAPRADVRLADALQTDLAVVLDELPEPRALVSNMPYNITGPLLTAIAAARMGFERAVLMMQREVGERVLAQAGTSERGSLSVFLQSQFDIKKVVAAPASAFMPPPKVASVVLEFVPVPTGMGEELERRFFEVVRGGFTQPRKTLANNLRSMNIDAGVSERVGLSQSIRPHQLTLDDWKRLSEALWAAR